MNLSDRCWFVAVYKTRPGVVWYAKSRSEAEAERRRIERIGRSNGIKAVVDFYWKEDAERPLEWRHGRGWRRVFDIDAALPHLGRGSIPDSLCM